MNIINDYEIVEIANEYIAVPIGGHTHSLNGAFVLSETAAFILKNLKDIHTEDEIINLIIEEYQVDLSTAQNDVHNFLDYLVKNNVIAL